jgi:hypothetical protein
MGLAKRAQEEAEARLFWPSDDVACDWHVENDYLRERLRCDNSESDSCVVCRACPDCVVPLDDLLDIVAALLRRYWGLALEDLFFDDESEDGFAGPSVSTTDEIVLHNFYRDLDEDLLELVSQRMLDDQWYDPADLWLQGSELLTYSWQLFAESVVEGRGHATDRDSFMGEHADGIPPELMLDRLALVVEDLALVTHVDAPLYRAIHIDASEPTTPKRLGTVPTSLATRPNRMSPPGTPMFYGALDAETAVAEIGPAPHGQRIVIGKWRPNRSLKLLDLATVPPPPSFYEVARATDREGLLFLGKFADEISKPIAPTEAEQLYRPTQTVTLYFRNERPELDGILYRSARTGAACVVLFIENDHCVASFPVDSSKQAWLRLVECESP